MNGESGLQIRRVAANVLNKQSQTTGKGWSSILALGEGLTTCHRKKINSILQNVTQGLGIGEFS
jgi:hypothetical protein